MSNQSRKSNILGNIKTSRKRLLISLFAALCIILLGVFLILRNPPWEPRRVNRKHVSVDPEQYREFTLRLGIPRQTQVYSRKEAEEDLDQLEWLIEHRYSYRDLKGVDYRTYLDAIRSNLGDGIARSDFAWQVQKLLALFGDGHTKIGSNTVWITSLCAQFLPFLVSETNGRLVAFEADRTDFVDPEYPFLTALDGVPIQKWIRAVSQVVPDSSPHFIRHHSIRYLRCVELLRKELGLDERGSIDVELESADGKSKKVIEMTLVSEKPNYGFWPWKSIPKKIEDIKVDTRITEENLGYIRIPLMVERSEFLESLIEAMRQVKNTDGLIIDVRGNGGGSRSSLLTLFPFFMTDDEPPAIVNVAAYRLGTKDRKEAFAARNLYPASSSRWSDAERRVIDEFSKNFRPAWQPSKDLFSSYYYFVIGPNRDEGTYHYDKPVVILQDTDCFSAADIFLGAFENRPNMTLMGSISGGGSGCRIKHRLKNSYIAVYLSSMVSYRPNGQLYDGKGIEPDIQIQPVPEYFIGKKDNILDEAVTFLIKKN